MKRRKKFRFSGKSHFRKTHVRLLILLVLVLAIAAYLYFFTDKFKNQAAMTVVPCTKDTMCLIGSYGTKTVLRNGKYYCDWGVCIADSSIPKPLSNCPIPPAQKTSLDLFTDEATLKKNLVGMKYISDLIVGCNRSRMDIYAINSVGRKVLIGAVKINTGKRAVPTCAMSTRLSSSASSTASGTTLSTTMPNVFINGWWWQIYDNISDTRFTPTPLPTKCLPADIKLSDTTPTGNFKILSKEDSVKDKGWDHWTGFNQKSMGRYKMRFSNTRDLYIHGGNLVFERSEGCIHMYDSQIAIIYPYVSKDVTRVQISQ